MPIEIRPATSGDYATFTRLVLELSVDDRIPSLEKFAAELAPTTLVAVDERGEPLGYTFFVIIKETAYVRHLVAAPSARRRGVGRALLAAVVERARAAGCKVWSLNVRPDNQAALALYESVGLEPKSTSRALRIAWSDLDRTSDGGELAREGVRVRRVTPADDARVEHKMGFISGQFAFSRTNVERVLLILEDDANGVVGAAVFDPAFPATSPFRVARSSLGVPFLRAMRGYSQPEDALVNVTIDDDPTLAGALLALGATVRLEILRMSGALPAKL